MMSTVTEIIESLIRILTRIENKLDEVIAKEKAKKQKTNNQPKGGKHARPIRSRGSRRNKS